MRQLQTRITSPLPALICWVAAVAVALLLAGCDGATSIFGDSTTGPSGSTPVAGVEAGGSCRQDGVNIKISCSDDSIDKKPPEITSIRWDAQKDGTGCSVSKAGQFHKNVNLDVAVCGAGSYTVNQDVYVGTAIADSTEYSVPVVEP